MWGTKFGEPLVEPQWENSLHSVIAAKATRLEALVHAVGGVENRVHLVVSMPPKVAPSLFIAQVKDSSSHWINNGLKLEYPFQWQAEYGVVSFGGKQLDRVVRYVKNQRKNHAERTTIGMLEGIGHSQDPGAEPPR